MSYRMLMLFICPLGILGYVLNGWNWMAIVTAFFFGLAVAIPRGGE